MLHKKLRVWVWSSGKSGRSGLDRLWVHKEHQVDKWMLNLRAIGGKPKWDRQYVWLGVKHLCSCSLSLDKASCVNVLQDV